MGKPEIITNVEKHEDLIVNGFNSLFLRPLDDTNINSLKNNCMFLRQSDNKLCFKDNSGVIKIITLT